ncbi:hypothetical protein [Helicobacter aurati]|uniref:hypothetical protein n=1 Tax=Helicobacter aurati TaxID=137778 RepID=UPI001F459489|nr:hypothetical protein [Helicobacter aurati]
MSIIGTIFRPLFATVLISVSYDEDTCIVQVAKKRGGSIVEETKKEFKIVNGEPSAETIKYIYKLKSRYAYSYLAMLSKSTEQVLVPGTKKNIFANFGVNEKEYKSIKLPNAFIFIHKDSVTHYLNTFKKAKGLDFVFSPFVLLFLKSKTLVGDRPKMFVLQEKENLATLIATRKETLYGSFWLISSEQPITTIAASVSKPSEENKMSNGKGAEEQLDNLDTELGDLEQDLQDFDSFDFSELESQDIRASTDSDSDSESTSSSDNLQDLSRSTSIIQLIQSSLRDFYQNTLYESDFVEEIVIFDCYGISSQSIHNIRSNLMIELSLIPTDLPKEIINLSQIELNS